MIASLVRICACWMAGAAFLCLGSASVAQSAGLNRECSHFDSASESSSTLSLELPDAPRPQQAQSPAPSSPQKPEASSSPQPSSQPSSQAETDAAAQEKSRREIAEEQLKQEKKQRLGILPNFNASYIANAVPLTPGQKFRLMLSTEKDPATIGFSMFVALIGQAEGSHSAYGGGIGGYGKRFGQNYADTFDGAFWGNAVLPSLWHQDPRYFRLGTGTAKHRIVYALLTNVRAKHDVTNKWEPNYSNLVGNLISGGISNLYLPSNERGLGSTFEGAAVVTAEGGIGSMLEEFYPDFLHYMQRRKQRKQAANLLKLAKP